MPQQQNNKMGIFNIFIIIYNFISVLSNFFAGYVSYISIAILAINLFITINALKVDKNNKAEKVCLVFEIITGLVILFAFI